MRERLSLDRNWRFALGHAASDTLDFDFLRSRCLVKAGEARGAADPKFDDRKWRPVDLPHDFALELPLDPRGDKELAEHGFHSLGPDHPESSVGWYRRSFDLPASDLGRRLSVEFDGVFRDSVVWLNGHRLGRHQSGYTSFRYDISEVANYGGKNVLVVRADASSWEGWWYEGAGIYRHVWLVKTSPVHVAPSGTFVTSTVADASAELTLRTRVLNESDAPADVELTSEILDPAGHSVAIAKSPRTTLAPWSESEILQHLRLKTPKLWSCDDPHLYRLHTRVAVGGQETDDCHTTFGIRTLDWDPARGFLLNGRPLKIKGTCNHQNHAGVGAAMPDRLHSLRLEKLKELGSNAYRCSHYAATPELLDACDRLGMLVVAENRLAASTPEGLGQFADMIVRDRNHPSIILWSIANEEHSVQWAVTGERIGRRMVELAHRLDPSRKVTAAMHDRGLGEGFANIVDVHGWNYINVGDINAFHQRRPDQPIVGTEEASTVCTRGIYADDPSRGYVSAYDKRAPGWGTTAEKWWTFFADRPWLAGGFVWTGFDYRGEPIPYKWPCTLSHFGLMDACGFPKDNYFYYRAWWQDQPVLHLLPHWNWPGHEGREIDVRCFSNCDRVELFLNGRPLGSREMKPNSHVAWAVLYEPGALEAHGYRAGKRIASSKVETTGAPARIRLSADRPVINADGEDLASITVEALDDHGRLVPLADNLVRFELDGPGRLLGVGNGDPSSHESDKAPHRRFFNGICLALVQSSPTPGTIRLVARSEGLPDAVLSIDTRPSPLRPSVP